jgi:lipid II:glycine glycyltransferase (peptidoglycan interpeptide bridge formation enzyme)
MLTIDKKIFIFDIKDVHFSESPFDIEGCDLLTFYYCSNKVDAKGFNCKEKLTSIIDLTQDLNKIWQKMSKTSVRYKINRAQKEGIKIQKNNRYEEFFDIYKNFMRKKGFKSSFQIFGVGIIPLEVMKKNGTLFVAEYNGELLGGVLLLEDKTNIEAFIAASKRLENETMNSLLISRANRLIWWEAIKYAKEKSLKEFDLGGLWSEAEVEKDPKKKGINTFKLKFGGEVVTRYLYEKIYSKRLKLLYNMYSLKKELL